MACLIPKPSTQTLTTRLTLDEVLPLLKQELQNTDVDLKTKLTNIRSYATVGLYMLSTQEVVSQKGQDILRNNDFMRDLVILMKTPTFKTFRRKHMIHDVKPALIYFELYEMLDKFYKRQMKESIPDDVAAELLKSIISRREYRTPLIGILHKYIQDGGSRKKLYQKLEDLFLDTEVTTTLTLKDH